MLLTKVDEFNVTEADFYLSEDQAYDFVRSIGEESPRLMAHIAMSNGHGLMWYRRTIRWIQLAQIWGVEAIETQPTDANSWVRARYTDGRPPLGVVSTNGFGGSTIRLPTTSLVQGSIPNKTTGL